ncbi:phage antirepressor [Novosphingobium sp. KN65.2]|uniref:phage antirepressor n=1 Tax=Novosphingobium sp. KN65.2 TaxID=1478134 RepID=UPI0005DE2ABD|nr:phage antirepressor [Novosphingobium sp. KN65.2]CDO36006.1 Prophage antirepressor [Novosphingobium sp. KN65.2]
MNAITPYSFESRPVRIIDRDGQPWFVAADVCAALDIANHRAALARLDDDEKGVVIVDTLGGMQSVGAINESGIYKLMFRSRKQGAKRFTKWLTSEVLPSIRRTGSYGAPAATLDLKDPAVLHRLLLDHTSNAMATEARVAELEPQVEALARLTQADGALCVTDAAKALGVPPRRLFSWLEANHWTYRRSDGGHWVAYQAKLDSGMLEHKGLTLRRHGMPDRLIEQVMVTPKGLTRLATIKAGA